MNLLRFFAVFGIILVAAPWISIAGAGILTVLHFVYGMSWLWMAVPGALFAAWVAFVLWAD